MPGKLSFQTASALNAWLSLYASERSDAGGELQYRAAVGIERRVENGTYRLRGPLFLKFILMLVGRSVSVVVTRPLQQSQIIR